MSRRALSVMLAAGFIFVLTAAGGWWAYDVYYRIPAGTVLPPNPPVEEFDRKVVELGNRASAMAHGFELVDGNLQATETDENGALELFDDVIAINPRYYRAFESKATLLIKLGRFREAADCLEQLTALRPRHAEGYVGLAYCYHRLNDASASNRALYHALGALNYRLAETNAADPSRDWIRFNRGVVLALMGRNAVAKRELAQIEIAGMDDPSEILREGEEKRDRWKALFP